MSELNPYQPPSASVADPVANTVQAEPAGRGTRLAAQIIDTLIMAIPISMLIIGTSLQGKHTRLENLSITLLVLGALGLLALIIANLAMLYRHGQTLGKRAMRVRIIRQNGERASLARILFLRTGVIGLLSNIPLAGPVVSLVDVLFIFRRSRRCVHDLIADTAVIKA